MLRILRRVASASEELTTIHQWRTRRGIDSRSDPFRHFRGLQKGFCVGVLPDGVDRNSEAFSSNSIAMEGILSELRSHIKKVNHLPYLSIDVYQSMLADGCISVSIVGIGRRWRGGGEEEQKQKQAFA